MIIFTLILILILSPIIYINIHISNEAMKKYQEQ